MHVLAPTTDLHADEVWLDTRSGSLCLKMKDRVYGFDFASIPDSDFESQSPVERFSIGQSGSVVICHHQDGTETWLPSDLWLN